ncbi:hypothetical protein FPQ18DRAFT_409135 [Pyronema domesticum]|nr:hypothetical protein FPQ18DRAFT_409135 [Pyronema domesticum]
MWQPLEDRYPGNKICQTCEWLDFSSLAREELPRSHPITLMLGPLAFVAVWKQNPPPTTVDGKPIFCKVRNRAVAVIRDAEGNDGCYHENFAENDYRYSTSRTTVTCDIAPAGCPDAVELQHIDNDVDIRGLFDDAKLFSRRPKEQLKEINFDLIKNWVSHCDKFHGEICRPQAIQQDHHDGYAQYFRLVDVRRNCVVDAKAEWDYFALSYVWGQTRPMLQLVLDNKDQLYEEGALAQDTHLIPHTIIDAIEAVRRIDGKYIWVDALCIMQDDYDEKVKVIGEMDLI